MSINISKLEELLPKYEIPYEVSKEAYDNYNNNPSRNGAILLQLELVRGDHNRQLGALKDIIEYVKENPTCTWQDLSKGNALDTWKWRNASEEVKNICKEINE